MKKENKKVVTNPKYTEILKLREYLHEEGLHHSLRKKNDGWQIVFRIENEFDNVTLYCTQDGTSLGENENLIEFVIKRGLKIESVKGFLNANHALSQIKDFIEKKNAAERCDVLSPEELSEKAKKTNKAKNCPLCGCSEIHVEAYDPFDGYRGSLSMWRISCRECGCNVVGTSRKDVGEKWNKRAKE